MNANDRGISQGYEASMIFVKTCEQIRKDLIKIPTCRKVGNWSSTLINFYRLYMGTQLQIHRQLDFVHFATHKAAWFDRDYVKCMKTPVNTSIDRGFGVKEQIKT